MTDETCVALSIRQPWCWAILCAGKNVENRSWFTAHRGRLILHAPRTFDEEGRQWLVAHGYEVPTRAAFVAAGLVGAVVGEAVLTGCRPVDRAEFDNNIWAHGPWCWVLEKPVAYPRPIKMNGFQGLFQVCLSPELEVQALGGER